MHDPESLGAYLLARFPDVAVVVNEAYGGAFYFVGAARTHPFATIVWKDDGYDNHSLLDRPGAYRLNLGVSDATFKARFGPPAADPAATGLDFTEADRLLPHPVYARQRWLSVVNPGARTWPAVEALIAEAHALAAAKDARRSGS